MNCSSNGVCQCGDQQYHNKATLTCVNQVSYMGSCTVDFNCRVDFYLKCLNGHCQCTSSYPIWSFGYNTCIVPMTYTGTCFVDSDCDASLNLVCNANGKSNCTCPKAPKASTCDCVRVFGNENYWDGSICKSVQDYNQFCINSSTSYMCKTITEGTYCQGITNKCKCPTFYYYNNATSSCQKQLLINVTCPQADACRSDLGLLCQSVCSCNSTTQFWNGNLCVNYFTYNTACTSSSQCAGNLICKSATSGLSCSCPVTILNGFCDCPTRISGMEYFWDGTQCAPAYNLYERCTYTYQCQTAVKSLSCINQNCSCSSNSMLNSAGICKTCSNGWYYARGYCFKGITIPYTNFCSISSGNVATACGMANSVIATKINGSDVSWLGSYITQDQSFYGSYASSCTAQCTSFQRYQYAFTSHLCSHGSPNHGMICQYTLS